MAEFVTTVRSETDRGAVYTVTIDNQKKLNTLNSDILAALKSSFEDLKTKEDLAVVILTGAGEKSFIGGANIYEMATLNPDTARTFITNLHHVCSAIRDIPAPVIARINGLCLGAGMEIAAICDLVVAIDSAEFAMPEVRVGIPSVIEAAVLPQILGASLARDLVMTARPMFAKEAHRAGLVHRLATPENLDEVTQTVVDDLLAGGRNALRLQKALCNAWENLPTDKAIQLGIDHFSDAYTGPEPQEMMHAFINRKR
jgi:enoyl-CoA hydratase